MACTVKDPISLLAPLPSPPPHGPLDMGGSCLIGVPWGAALDHGNKVIKSDFKASGSTETAGSPDRLHGSIVPAPDVELGLEPQLLALAQTNSSRGPVTVSLGP